MKEKRQSECSASRDRLQWQSLPPTGIGNEGDQNTEEDRREKHVNRLQEGRHRKAGYSAPRMAAKAQAKLTRWALSTIHVIPPAIMRPQALILCRRKTGPN